MPQNIAAAPRVGITTFPARIDDPTPSQYTDERYPVIEIELMPTSGEPNNTLSWQDKPNGRQVIATNMTEWPCGGHMLMDGHLVQIMSKKDIGEAPHPPTMRYFFWASPGWAVYEEPPVES
ncbi:MAG: hypothetical protein ACE5FM_00075 [Methyloligellaceae bacterium]